MKVTLKIYEGASEILSRILDEGVYRAGRSEFSDIVPDSDAISRSHLELRVTSSAAYMTNMSTAGKVKVNGKARETVELADGDELSVGPYRILVFHGARDDIGRGEAPAEVDLGGKEPARRLCFSRGRGRK